MKGDVRLTIRQRNARLELSNANDNPENLLAALHAERETLEQETRRRAEQEEDDAMVAKYFAKIPSGPPAGASATLQAKEKGKGKEKEKREPAEAVDGDGDGVGDGVVDGADGDDSDGSSSQGDLVLPTVAPALTVKRSIPVSTGIAKPGVVAEPSVASILAAKGRALDAANAGTGSATNGTAAAQAQVKRKREGMQKLLGIKKKKA